MLGWLDDDPNARCVPIHCLPAFSPKARYANPTSRRSEIEGWIAGVRQVRAWLDAAGRSKQLLLCVGDGRGDTEALARGFLLPLCGRGAGGEGKKAYSLGVQ